MKLFVLSFCALYKRLCKRKDVNTAYELPHFLSMLSMQKPEN